MHKRIKIKILIIWKKMWILQIIQGIVNCSYNSLLKCIHHSLNILHSFITYLNKNIQLFHSLKHWKQFIPNVHCEENGSTHFSWKQSISFPLNYSICIWWRFVFSEETIDAISRSTAVEVIYEVMCTRTHTHTHIYMHA